jgi:predicted ABC-type ATPase
LILVLAGVNGAGKSSIAGASLRAHGQACYNPDEEVHRLHGLYPQRRLRDIYHQVLVEGEGRLKEAIRQDHHYTFETTLGGDTTTGLLLDAIAAGVAVHIWYCGLNGPDLHVERVAARVARGGHRVSPALIHSRYRASMKNLCRLAPGVQELALYDNSAPLNSAGKPDRLRRLLHLRDGQWLQLEIPTMPDWAKPVAAVLMQRYPAAEVLF